MGVVERECEERLAQMVGRGGGVLVSRATVGLAGVLRGLGLARGRGVLMPVMVCTNVVHGVRGAGLEPVFVDVEVQRGGIGMDLGAAERVVDAGCGVVLAIPLFGGQVDVEGVMGFAERHGLVVVEDAAQASLLRIAVAQRASGLRSGYVAGSVGLASVFSFGVGKIGDAGGGGVVLSDDWGLLERIRDGLVGGIWDRKNRAARIMRMLNVLGSEMEGRARLAREYRERLRMEGVEHAGGDGVLPLWKYSVLVGGREERDRVTRRLLEGGVEASNLYVPLSRWFGGYGVGEWGRGEFPGAWDIYERIVNLPLWPQREGMVESVVEAFS